MVVVMTILLRTVNRPIIPIVCDNDPWMGHSKRVGAPEDGSNEQESVGVLPLTCVADKTSFHG